MKIIEGIPDLPTPGPPRTTILMDSAMNYLCFLVCYVLFKLKP